MHADIRHLQNGVLGELPFHVQVPFLDRRSRIVKGDGAGAAAGIAQARWWKASGGIRRSGKSRGKLQSRNRIGIELNGLIAKESGGIVRELRIVLVGLQTVEDAVPAAQNCFRIVEWRISETDARSKILKICLHVARYRSRQAFQVR